MTLRFHLAWTDNSTVVNGYNYTCLSDYKVEAVYTLDVFKVTESFTVIIVDQKDAESWINI